MRLKSLELQGFKSFPDKTLLSFPHPITAIVGPNGSGKSNLSDAIRWVLGEQSARSLRGGKMEDVIFGGAQDRRRQGFAQVTLTLEQCQDLLPDGGQEVAVTRRYYRSGESEYAINGTAVRLRDVNELFMDTGLGQEGYALIGQGKIDEILSAKSTQRREIFEEAAGISHCRHQKEETQRKLEHPGEPAADWGQTGGIELQHTPAGPGGTGPDLLGPAVRSCGCWKSPLDGPAGPAACQECGPEKDLATARQELESCSVQADQLYAKGETLLQQLRDQQAQAEALRAQFQDNEAQLRDNRQRVELLRDRVRANEAGAQRTQADLAQQQSRRQALEADLARQQAQLTQLRAQEDALQTRMEAVRKDLEDTREQLRQADSAWQAALRRDREELAECRRREREAEEAWMALRMQEHTLGSRAKLLEEMAQHYEGYGKGVKTAMEEVRRGNLRGVFGPVGELFRVSPRDTVALETALGGAMQNLLVEDEQAGKAVLRLVKQREGGRVTCLPLTALRPAVLREEGLEREPGYLAVAAELVSCEEVLRPAVNALLGRTVVVDHLDHGVQLAKARRYRFPVVTLEGEILRPGGSMTGGSVNRRGPSLWGPRGSPPGPVGPGPAGRAQGGEVLERARRETQRAAEALEARQSAGPTPPETLLRSQNDQEETLRTLGEELASLRGTMGAFSPLLAQLRHQLRTAEADQARQDGLLRDTVQQTQALEKEIAQREAKVETLRLPGGHCLSSWSRAPVKSWPWSGPGWRMTGRPGPRMTCSCGCSERPGCWSRESCRPAWRKNASWTGCGTPMA
ncbi:MAG: AAA family ATPase [Evtepia gabavorous]